MTRRVVITGVGAVTPLGVGAPILYERWEAGCSGIDERFGRCSDYEPADHLSTKEIRRADRYTQLAVVAAREAVGDAGWDGGSPYDPERVGSIIGTGIGGLSSIADQRTLIRDRGSESVSPLAVPNMMANAAAGVIAMDHVLKGECYAVLSACASGAHAIGAAKRSIEYGSLDACVTGGSEAAIHPYGVTILGQMGATSTTGLSCPFDARREGFVIGEGAGILVLEEEEAARARGADILGRLAGYGATGDAYHVTVPEPTGSGAAAAITLALAEAEIAPADVDYVNAHGTSTPLNDRSETAAIKLALGDHAMAVPTSSLKSAIGHLVGAAGAVEAVATLLALREGMAPPTINYEEPEEGLDLDYVPNVSKPLRPEANGGGRIGVTNSFGFGGHNAVLCLRAAAANGGERA